MGSFRALPMMLIGNGSDKTGIEKVRKCVL